MQLIKNQNIVFVINSLEGGGAEKVICNWLAEMESVFIQSHSKVTLILLDDLPEANIAPYYINKITLNSKGKILLSYKSLKDALVINKPDIIFSFLNRSNVICTIIGRQLHIPTIISERSNTSQHFNKSLKGKLSKLIVRTIYPKASKVIAVSEGVRHDLVANFRVQNERCITLHNAYNTDQLIEKSKIKIQPYLPENSFIIAIGRLHSIKNFELLINAYAQSNINIPLFILGEGPLQKKLQNQIDSLGCADKIFLKGYQTNPYPYIQKAAFMVSTSNAEGFPNAIVEALCLGTPVVATNCDSGPAEILAGDVNFKTIDAEIVKYGVLCKPRCIHAVKNGLVLMAKIEKTKAYRQKLHARATQFSFDIVRKTLINEINNLVKSK
jgi:N-acetylgalactosamine-N,N'-diacetylbacillosaminyl-diphospho-undecaprenol 4-alpha-N-acetylgalactosaminyltransferase